METFRIIQLIVFILGTAFLLIISKKSLSNQRVHGFYRFFVFEFTFILILLNLPFWFKQPLSAHQIISWFLLIVSIYYVAASFYFLTKIGGSKSRKRESANFKFENTANLVKDGVYKYIRHPMYSSLLFLSLGAMFKNISIFTILLEVLILLFLFLTAKFEENENIEFFGEAYREYMKGTKMFIPFIF